MTANQIYKMTGTKIPFSEWIGEQKTAYGDEFIKNEEFLNMAGGYQNWTDDAPRTPEQVVLENADENIVYPTTPPPTPQPLPSDSMPSSAGFSMKANVGQASVGGSVEATKGSMKWVYLVGAIGVGYLVYREMKKRKVI
tara:strand:+ start:142 stop:558 length:417 start_codon:yes stop_codon:yes gene_type:complete